MSAFGSSVINKSSKILAPKAPVRRRAPATPTTVSSGVSESSQAQNVAAYLPSASHLGHGQAKGARAVDARSRNAEDDTSKAERAGASQDGEFFEASSGYRVASRPAATVEAQRATKRRRLGLPNPTSFSNQAASERIEDANFATSAVNSQQVQPESPSYVKKWGSARPRRSEAALAGPVASQDRATVEQNEETGGRKEPDYSGSRRRPKDSGAGARGQSAKEVDSTAAVSKLRGSRKLVSKNATREVGTQLIVNEGHRAIAAPAQGKNVKTSNRKNLAEHAKPSTSRELVVRNQGQDGANVNGVAEAKRTSSRKQQGRESEPGGSVLVVEKGKDKRAANEDTIAKPTRPKRTRQSKGDPPNQSGEQRTETAVGLEGNVPEEPDHGGPEQLDAISTSIPPPLKKGRKRAATPDSAEEHVIDTDTITMSDLCKDSRRGKKSKLEKEFQNIDWGEVVRRRKAAEEQARAGETRARVGVQTLEHQPNEELEQTEPQNQVTATQGPRLKLVNGEMVVDTSSLVIDRHAGARPDETQPAVEEQDITRRVNTRSWLFDNRRDPNERYRVSNKADPWSHDETDSFYGALKMFGTDFFMISKMFPGRTRRHIKMKFVREERNDPSRVKEALIGGSVAMDLNTYCEYTGQQPGDYKDPELLQEELKADEERQRAEIEKQKEEQAEAQRKKQEAAAAKAAASRQRAKTGEKKGRKRKQKRQQEEPAADKAQDGDEQAADAQHVVETIEDRQ